MGIFWGLIEYDRFNDDLGEYINLNPTWGKTGVSIETTNTSENMGSYSLSSVNYVNGFQLGSEFGYGFKILGGSGKFTPYSQFDFSDTNGNKYGIGSRISVGSNLNFELEGSSEQTSSSSTEQKINVSGSLNW